MEAVEVVELRDDGSCPRCEGNYSQGKAPVPEGQLTEYVMHFSGRNIRTMGWYTGTARRKAATVEGAWDQLYPEYEHITRGSIEEVSRA